MNTRSSNKENLIEMVDLSKRANRYLETSQPKDYFLSGRALELTPEVVMRSASRINNLEMDPIHFQFNESLKNESKDNRLSNEMLQFRKGAILYVYCYILGSPPPDVWGGPDGSLSEIIKRSTG